MLNIILLIFIINCIINENTHNMLCTRDCVQRQGINETYPLKWKMLLKKASKSKVLDIVKILERNRSLVIKNLKVIAQDLSNPNKKAIIYYGRGDQIRDTSDTHKRNESYNCVAFVDDILVCAIKGDWNKRINIMHKKYGLYKVSIK
jgi:hypothetical protein